MTPAETPAIIPADTLAARTQLVYVVADKFQLPREVVLGICRTESELNRWAIRYEPDYRYLWNCRTNQPYLVRPQDMTADRAPSDFPACPGMPDTTHTEWVGQQMSYGLMQVMGALAREMGFRGWFGQLSDVLTGCEVGCRHLVQLRGEYFGKFGWSGVYAAYNGGSPILEAGKKYRNQDYVDKVIKNGGPT